MNFHLLVMVVPSSVAIVSYTTICPQSPVDGYAGYLQYFGPVILTVCLNFSFVKNLEQGLAQDNGSICI